MNLIKIVTVKISYEESRLNLKLRFKKCTEVFFLMFPPFLLDLLEGNYKVGYKPFWSFETDWRNIHEGSDVAH